MNIVTEMRRKYMTHITPKRRHYTPPGAVDIERLCRVVGLLRLLVTNTAYRIDRGCDPRSTIENIEQELQKIDTL